MSEKRRISPKPLVPSKSYYKVLIAAFFINVTKKQYPYGPCFL